MTDGFTHPTRNYRTGLWIRFWIFASVEWLLLGLLFHTFVFTGGAPFLPAVTTEANHGKEGVDGSSPSEGFLQ